MKLKRRDFLKGLLAGVAAVAWPKHKPDVRDEILAIARDAQEAAKDCEPEDERVTVTVINNLWDEA